MEIVPVFFTFNKNYVVAAEVAIYSLLKYASPRYEYKLYVLHTDIPCSMQKEMSTLVSKFANASLEFIETSAFDDDEHILQEKSHFSKEIYYKLIAAEIFPQYDRIICTDVDVVFTGDISESYFMHPGKFFYYAGIGQILESDRMKNYKSKFDSEEIDILKKEIAAGYLLMNLKAIREHSMQKKLTDYYKANYHRLCLPEQDCMILCCWPQVEYLPIKFCVCNYYYKTDLATAAFYPDNDDLPKVREEACRLFNEALSHPVQLHYVGPSKPWNSLFVTKQSIWLSLLWESGCTARLLKALPRLMQQKLKRYSLKRFLSKVAARLKHGKTAPART